MNIALLPGERRINSWSVSYRMPGGRVCNGRLTVTDKRLLVDTKFDLAAKPFLPEVMFIKWGSVGYIEIDKKDICRVDVIRNFWRKRTVLILADGTKHVFNHGVWDISGVLRAINQNRDQ